VSSTEAPQNATSVEMNASTARRDKHAHANPFFLSCLKRNEHSVPGFTPVTRFVGVELDRTIQEMEEISASEIARFRYGHFNRETLTKGIQVAESDVEFGLDDVNIILYFYPLLTGLV
jgi:hypothetical protein